MPELNGHKTMDLIAAELGVNVRKIRQAIDALKLQAKTFNVDQRYRYYSAEDIKQIKQWLLGQ